MVRDLIDAEDGENRAVRAFLMHYGAPGLTVKQQRDNMRRAGWECWPSWVSDVHGHLTKAGAQDWLRYLFALESAAGVPACQPATDKITIRYERAGRCFWHIACTAQRHAPPMRVGQDDAEKRRTAIHCTACNEAGYYPHGSVGEVCCERVTDGVGEVPRG